MTRSSAPRREPVQVAFRQGPGGLSAEATVASAAYRTEIDRPLTPPPTHDWALFQVLMHCMRKRIEPVFTGPLTPRAVRNARELVAAWTSWLPRVYFPIPIEPAAGIAAPAAPGERDDAFVHAHSGGVDSTYALAHAIGSRDALDARPGLAMIAHGLDTFLESGTAFERSLGRVRSACRLLGVELCVVRTNAFRPDGARVGGGLWGFESGVAAAALLHLFSGELAGGAVATNETYRKFVVPWGSNPVVNPLLAGDGFEVRHRGAAVSRVDKLRWLVRHAPEVVRHLRVCFTPTPEGANCGRCEKCVRTYCGLRCAGAPDADVAALFAARPTPLTVFRGAFPWNAGAADSCREMLPELLRSRRPGRRWFLACALGTYAAWPTLHALRTLRRRRTRRRLGPDVDRARPARPARGDAPAQPVGR